MSPGSGGGLGLGQSAKSAERPFCRRLRLGLYTRKPPPSPPRWFLMRETVLGSKLFIDCSLWKMDAYQLLRVDQRLNTFCRKECLGREAYWLNLPQSPSRYLISMKNSVLIYVTIGHTPLWGVWLCVLDQESGGEQGDAYCPQIDPRVSEPI